MKRTFTGQELELLRALADISIEDAHIVKKIEREGYEGIPATAWIGWPRVLTATTQAEIPGPRP